jgi:cation:H+ antiporter
MPIDARQAEELWLTATQGLYATAAIIDLRFSLRQALAILGLFLVQLGGSIALEATGHAVLIEPFHLALCVVYSLLAVERFIAQREHLGPLVRAAFPWLRREGR